jgi:hypothetical protein
MGTLADELRAALATVQADATDDPGKDPRPVTTRKWPDNLRLPSEQVEAANRRLQLQNPSQEAAHAPSVAPLPSARVREAPPALPLDREHREVARPATPNTPNRGSAAAAPDHCKPRRTRSGKAVGIDWWIRIVAPHRADWARIEPMPTSESVTVVLINQDSGIFERFTAPSELDAKARLVRLRFDRRAAKQPWIKNYTPPVDPWRETPGQATRPRASSEGAAPASPSRSDPPKPSEIAERAHKAESKAAPQTVELSIGENPRCLLYRQAVNQTPLSRLRMSEGRAIQCPGRSKPDEHEVTIGLDFGTSSTKVVIGDSSLDKVFAVPFCDASGVNAYLLPTRLFEQSTSSLFRSERRTFSLQDGMVCHRDLKLGWLANPDSRPYRERVVAFLALVIRHARGWLFHEHASVYKTVKIAWRVSIGLPAATVLESGPANALSDLVRRAWIVAGAEVELDANTVRSTLDGPVRVGEDAPEVNVIPEIAAQVFGFVTSQRFDAKAVNRYLLIDVGSGTVDASLFRVYPERGRKWNFDFFTAVVQPNGASNLHVHRVNWWTTILARRPELAEIAQQLKDTQFFTDIGSEIPERYTDYVSGVGVRYPGSAAPDPDHAFLFERLIPQVRGDTLCRARDFKLLAQDDLKNVPLFLCGGGSRMKIYQRIATDLVEKPGISWPTAQIRALELPDDLEVETQIGADYDRLSVAYGLGRIDTGRIRKATPILDLNPTAQDPWRNRYVDKDQL